MFFTRDIGIDLGTANTLVYMKGRGIIIREPSVVAVDVHTDKVRCVGEAAKEVIGRTPESVAVVRPLRDGVIADFDITISMLEDLIRRALGTGFLLRPRVVICVPSGVTGVERRAVRDVTEQAGARKVLVIEEPMAAALGAGLPVSEPTASMVADIGGGTSEVAVISLGGIVASRSVRVGGDKFDEAIASYVRRNFNLLIGEPTAEKVKIQIGSAMPLNGEGEQELSMEIKGRNLLTGLPQSVHITSQQVRQALLPPLKEVVEAVRYTLERTPPDLSADIIDRGIMLTGGGALLRGIDRLIHEATSMPVKIAENPLDCVAVGSGLVLDNLDAMADALSEEDLPQYNRQNT